MVYDISSKINQEVKTIKIADGLEFKVDDSFKTVMKVMEMSKNGSEDVEEIIKVLLGKAALEEIEKANLSFGDYITISKALMATITGQTIEEFDKRFQN